MDLLLLPWKSCRLLAISSKEREIGNRIEIKTGKPSLLDTRLFNHRDRPLFELTYGDKLIQQETEVTYL